MNFAEVIEQGRRDFPEDEAVAKGLRRVLTTPEILAPLVRWLELRRDGYRGAMESQTLVGHHPQMAHCAGSGFALTGLLEEMERIVTTPAKGE